MKKLLLTLAALTVIAAPSYAFVQSGSPSHVTHPGLPVDGNAGVQDVGVGALTPPGGTPIEPAGEVPPITAAVPEPATMVLASMGLIALGAAGRKRGKSN
jgi:hypothetical protein